LAKRKNTEVATTTEDGKSLSELRGEIRELTKSILALVEARQTLSLGVAEIKKKNRDSIENLRVEDELVDSMVDYSSRIGLDPELGGKMVHTLIESSKLVQTEAYYKQSIQRFLESENIRKISIVGAGRMGAWFAKYFRQLDVAVLIYDKDREKAKKKAREISSDLGKNLDDVVGSDLVVLAVPIAKTPGVILELSKAFGSRGSTTKLKIMEISSVKSELAEAGLINDSSKNPLKNEMVELYSIHPLFGAGANEYGKNTILQVYPQTPNLVQGIFPHYSIVTLDWETHDRLMGLFLSVPHTLALIFAYLLSENDLGQGRGSEMKSPSFTHMLELSRRVVGENPEVYFEIEASNPFTTKVLKDLGSSLRKLNKSLNSREEFIEFFEKARRAIDS
jgi:prephenate dehydrogenase/chorismate mutase